MKVACNQRLQDSLKVLDSRGRRCAMSCLITEKLKQTIKCSCVWFTYLCVCSRLYDHGRRPLSITHPSLIAKDRKKANKSAISPPLQPTISNHCKFHISVQPGAQNQLLGSFQPWVGGWRPPSIHPMSPCPHNCSGFHPILRELWRVAFRVLTSVCDLMANNPVTYHQTNLWVMLVPNLRVDL